MVKRILCPIVIFSNLNTTRTACRPISRDIGTHASVDANETEFPLLTSNLPTDRKITNNFFSV